MTTPTNPKATEIFLAERPHQRHVTNNVQFQKEEIDLFLLCAFFSLFLFVFVLSLTVLWSAVCLNRMGYITTQASVHFSMVFGLLLSDLHPPHIRFSCLSYVGIVLCLFHNRFSGENGDDDRQVSSISPPVTSAPTQTLCAPFLHSHIPIHTSSILPFDRISPSHPLP